jgi:hypothetical protein
MLTLASLGLAGYGLYSVIVGVAGVIGPSSLEIWANLGLILLGAMLMLAAAFVRASMPGAIALALAGVLGLQSLSLHNATHLYGHVAVVSQIARATFAGVLILLAYLGWAREDPAAGPDWNRPRE